MSDFLRRVNGWLWKAKPTEVSASQPGTGALLDTRSPEQKLEDVHFAEVVGAAAPVTWVLKASSSWRKFLALNQNGCSACVAFTMAKILGILRWLKDGIFVTFSPGDIYGRRSNKNVADGQGMIGIDAFGIAAQGVTLDVLTPSQNLSEADMNALKVSALAREVSQLFRLGGATPVFLPVGDIDAVASVIQVTGKPVMVWFYFTAGEWGINALPQTGSTVPSDLYNRPAVLTALTGVSDPRALLHSATAVDFTLTPDGKKALVLEDSAWFGGYCRRLIDEDFFAARNWFAVYPLNLARVKTSTEAPSLAGFAKFTKPLVFIPYDSTKGQPADMVLNAAQHDDVVRLQQALQILTDTHGAAYFPVNAKCSGYYGAQTAAAIYHWQSDNTVAPQDVLDGLMGRRFGDASIKEINSLIS